MVENECQADDNILNYFSYPVHLRIHQSGHFSARHFICLSPHSSVARINAPHFVLSVNSPRECSKRPWCSGASGAKLCASTARRLNIVRANITKTECSFHDPWFIPIVFSTRTILLRISFQLSVRQDRQSNRGYSSSANYSSKIRIIVRRGKSAVKIGV